MADGGSVERPFARITLDGTRFDNARLPVDALAELQRYTALLRDYAATLWRDDHPGVALPEDFDESFDLAITRIERGSAASLLNHPKTAYDDYWEKSRDEIDAAFYAIVNVPVGTTPGDAVVDEKFDGDTSSDTDATDVTSVEATTEAHLDFEVPDSPAADFLVTRDEFRLFGSGLRPSESLLLVPNDDTGDAPKPTVVINPATARPRFESLYREQPKLEELVEIDDSTGPRAKYSSTVAGRLYALNAEKQNYRVHTLHYGDAHGRYSDQARTEDLRGMLGTSQSAPLVRITGRMSWNDDGSLYRILQSDRIELLDIAKETWSRRFIELASLPPDWHPEVTSQLISFDAIDAARHVLRELDKASPQGTGPGSIFPRADGGVILEWTDGINVVTMEVSPAPDFSGWKMSVTEDSEQDFEDSSVENAVNFVRETFT